MAIITNPDNTTYDNAQPFKMVDANGVNLTADEIAAIAAQQAAYAAAQAALAPARNVAVAIAAGVVLTSTGTPALNGIYNVDAAAQANINAVMTYVLANSAFPAGLSALPWPDTSGAMHVFPSINSFKAFATAVADFVAHVVIYGSSGGAVGSIPSNAITIA